MCFAKNEFAGVCNEEGQTRPNCIGLFHVRRRLISLCCFFCFRFFFFFNRDGEIKHADLGHVFRGGRFPPQFIEECMQLLQKFEVVLPYQKKDVRFWLIPSLLPPERPSSISHATEVPPSKRIKRCYAMAYIPDGLMARLIARLHTFAEMMLPKEGPPSQPEMWRSGICVTWPKSKAFFLVTTEVSHCNLCAETCMHAHTHTNIQAYTNIYTHARTHGRRHTQPFCVFLPFLDQILSQLAVSSSMQVTFTIAEQFCFVKLDRRALAENAV